GMRNAWGPTRRGVLAAGASLMALAVTGGTTDAAQRQSQERFTRPRVFDLRRRILVKDSTIISMDARIRDLARGDILIEGSRIVEVGPNIRAADAQAIDASNMIAIPGFVDCHRHSWEGQLRRINPNAQTLADYSNATHLSFATFYRPQDMYVGNFLPPWAASIPASPVSSTIRTMRAVRPIPMRLWRRSSIPV